MVGKDNYYKENRARPPIENPKSEQIKIRATKKDKELLEKCCEKLNQTQYEVIMTGIKKVYAETEKKIEVATDKSLQLLLCSDTRKYR